MSHDKKHINEEIKKLTQWNIGKKCCDVNIAQEVVFRAKNFDLAIELMEGVFNAYGDAEPSHMKESIDSIESFLWEASK
jgi:pterin-4a-carbinolamine dehydratase